MVTPVPFRFARGEVGWRVEIAELTLRPGLEAKLMNTLGRSQVPLDIAIVGHYRAFDDWWICVARDAGSPESSGVALGEAEYRRRGFDPFALLEEQPPSQWIERLSGPNGESYLADARARFLQLRPALRETEFWSVLPRDLPRDTSPGSSYRVGGEGAQFLLESSAETPDGSSPAPARGAKPSAVRPDAPPPPGLEQAPPRDVDPGPTIEETPSSEGGVLEAITGLRRSFEEGRTEERRALEGIEQRLTSQLDTGFEGLPRPVTAAEVSAQVVADLPRPPKTSWQAYLAVALSCLVLGALGGVVAKTWSEGTSQGAPDWFESWRQEEAARRSASSEAGVPQPPTAEDIADEVATLLGGSDSPLVSRLADALRPAPVEDSPSLDARACKTLLKLLEGKLAKRAKQDREHALQVLEGLGCVESPEGEEETE